ncbi:hypothetical protein C1I64_16520 [Rathayibacter festucae DSM 15932]|uniref:Uncharacterized protein n=1 Tax=Rathayibacter festucae DSM 15932 TaxID=1328866 RepID=A0A3T0T4I6_9MICO|nr:hypothetical protein C1I64_16520 [Rathayibacter festucae DSM 15932]
MVSAPDLNADVLAPFRDSGIDRHVTLLLGAGASTSSGLPGWDELAVRLLLKSGAVRSETAAQELVQRQDPLLVAEAAKSTLNRWDQGVRAALYQGLQDLSPSSLHLAAAGHALAGGTDETTVATLNFDVLLEDAVDIEGTAEGRVDDEVSSTAYVVHHLHGIASPSRSEGVVLTLSDYNELLGDQDCWQQRLLTKAAQDGAIVIAGTSYRDPDVRRWLHVALADSPNGNAALVLLARQAFGVSRERFDEIKSALAGQWRAAGLQPILLEDFTDAAQIIRELRHLHRPRYRSPQQRATALWDLHVDGFDVRQPEYSDALDDDARSLRDAFDVEQLGVSLWLADGAGSVGRYASQDRTYRAATDIRRVPSGHDSAWVAGRTLGAESIVFQNLDPAGTTRWGTVLALPIRVSFEGLPDIATAVLSVGLPGTAEAFSTSKAMWFDQVLDIANAWSERLSDSLV